MLSISAIWESASDTSHCKAERQQKKIQENRMGVGLYATEENTMK